MATKRKGGSGTVRLRKDGRWEGRHVIGYDEKGLPKTKGVLAKTKAECVAKLKALQESYLAPQSQKLKSDMTFGDWVQFWYEIHKKPNLRPKTQVDYKNRIFDHIIPEVGHIPLNKLTANDLQQFYTRMKNSGRKSNVERYGAGLSDRMVSVCHITCTAALERAVADGLLSRNPAKECRLPPRKEGEVQVLTHEELQRFLVQAKEEGYYELFLLELATGVRRGELLALRWDDLNFDTGALNISKQVYRVDGALQIAQPKTKAALRTIILPPSVVGVLRNYRKNCPSTWMFPSPKKEDSPLDPASVRKKLQTILDHAQCKRVRFHDLRHTFATNAVTAGMDVKTLSTIIGHVSARTTLNTYTHATEVMKQNAALCIDRGIANAPTESVPQAEDSPTKKQPFQPYQGQRRKAGTGCISQINEVLWEGRYSPRWVDGKRNPRNIYAHSLEECEEKLAVLITEMKAELAVLKQNPKSA